MGFLQRMFDGRRAAKVSEALVRDDPGAQRALRQLAPPVRAQALVFAARHLFQDTRTDEALVRLEEALAEAPRHTAALELKAWVLMEVDPAAAVETLEQLVAAAPREEAPRLDLVDALIAADRADDALARLEPLMAHAGPPILLRAGKAHFAAGRSAQALELLDVAIAQAASMSRSDPFGGDITAGDPVYIELAELHDTVLAEVHGAEAVTVDHALRGRLDARAGVNYSLLAKSLIPGRAAPPIALELSPIAAQRADGKARLARDGDDVAGHLLAGMAELREGDFHRAMAHFEAAQRRPPVHFAAVLGEGACRQLDELRAVQRMNRLPPPGNLAPWEAVVPELPHLGKLELRVVSASLQPFAGMREHLVSAGARIRILPVDVLATDLPELADLRGEREEGDHRSWDGLEGLASSALAVAKVETLLDVQSQAGWTFAHELAHLVLTHAPDALAAELEDHYQRFLETEHVGSEYQLQNLQEFFACGYVDFLNHRHGLPLHHELDDEGLVADLFALYGRLEQPWR